MSKIRWGILGTGKINRKMVPAIKTASNAELVAIASRSEDRAKTVAKEYDISRYYGSYEQLLEDDDIDAVYLPLPNHLHKKWVIKAAQTGKHVLCEKPFTLSEVDAREMIDTGKKHEVVVMEGFMYRFNPIVKKLKQLVDKQTIGQLKAIEFTFAHDLVGYIREDDNYRYHQKYGGGALLDLGVYGINFCNYITGSNHPSVISSVRYTGGSQTSENTNNTENLEDTAVDVTSSILLRYDQNIICQITSSFEYYGRQVMISGTDGSIRVEDLVSADENTIRITRSDGKQSVLTTEAHNHYQTQVEQFGRYIIEGVDPEISPEDTYGVIRAVEESLSKSITI